MLIIAGACALLAVVLGVTRDHPSAFDTGIGSALSPAFGTQTELLRLLVLPSEPSVLVPVVAVAALLCALQGRWRETVLVAGAPAVAVAVNTWAVKPVFVGLSEDQLPYPSGHTVSLVAVVTVLALAARPGVGTWVTAGAGGLLILGAAIGMIVVGYHHATEIAGGALLAVAVVLVMHRLLGTGSRVARVTVTE